MSDKPVSNSAPAAVDEDSGVLVVVPCGRSKIWDRDPGHGSVAAAHAYTGKPFRLNCQYAERFGDAWIVLSAKYGFIAPDFSIPAPYEVSFKYPVIGPITVDQLRQQVREKQLGRHPIIVGLGGNDYRAAVEVAFADSPARLVFPFAGLPLGKSLQAAKRAIVSGEPGINTSEAGDGQSH